MFDSLIDLADSCGGILPIPEQVRPAPTYPQFRAAPPPALDAIGSSAVTLARSCCCVSALSTKAAAAGWWTQPAGCLVHLSRSRHSALASAKILQRPASTLPLFRRSPASIVPHPPVHLLRATAWPSARSQPAAADRPFGRWLHFALRFLRHASPASGRGRRRRRRSAAVHLRPFARTFLAADICIHCGSSAADCSRLEKRRPKRERCDCCR